MTAPRLDAAPPAAPAARDGGLLLPCPRCGQAEASVTLYLADLDTLECGDCGEEFTLDEVRALVERWGRIIAWIDQAPRL